MNLREILREIMNLRVKEHGTGGKWDEMAAMFSVKQV